MQDRLVGNIRADVEVWAAGRDTASALLLKADACVQAQSPFDRNARVGLPQLQHDVDIEMYLAFLTTQVLGWGDPDFSALQRIIAAIRPAFEALPWQLPSKIWLVQTTGREEAAAAYTKHDNTIVLPANMVASVQAIGSGGDPLHSGFSDGFLTGVVTHEFFHILSKNNPQARASWYDLVGYRELPNQIVLPDTGNWWTGTDATLPMAALKITNPDAPLINVAIDLPPSEGATAVPMAPVLLSTGPYVSGAFFETLQWLFLEVEETNGVASLKLDANGVPIVHQAADLMQAYHHKIGYYLSGELFHPDELLAQSFAAAGAKFRPPLMAQIEKAMWPNWGS